MFASSGYQLSITSAQPQAELFDLPWSTPLVDWPKEIIAALPRGISRHVVRFVHTHGEIYAIKEIPEGAAYHEYEVLRDLRRHNAPCVEPIAVVRGRSDGENELPAALITRHLTYSLPYRVLFGQSGMRPETVNRLVDALAVLMVRLHLLGFFWGDVSLSNTLFRRDADEFAAYLVDAETGDLYAELSDGKRLYDVDVAATNIVGELMDLQAGGVLTEDFDVVTLGLTFEDRYNKLWNELTAEESFALNERWRIEQRIQRLNDLGFEVGELSMQTSPEGHTISIQPKVVDAGHYSRKILQLTGLDVQEKQAQRMFNAMKSYRALNGLDDMPASMVAHQWMMAYFEPVMRAVPLELRGKLEPAQIFHEFLDHRWYISEQAGYDVPFEQAIQSYIDNVLKHRPNESRLLAPMEPLPGETGEFDAVREQEKFAAQFNADFDDDWSGYLA